MFKIDASVSVDVYYPANGSQVQQLSFVVNYPFIVNQEYYILLDQGKNYPYNGSILSCTDCLQMKGIAVGTDYCGLVSPAVQDPHFWRIQLGMI